MRLVKLHGGLYDLDHLIAIEAKNAKRETYVARFEGDVEVTLSPEQYARLLAAEAVSQAIVVDLG